MATWQYVPAASATAQAAASNAWDAYPFVGYEAGVKHHSIVGQITIKFTSIVTAASFDWYLSTDEAGAYPVTPLVSGAAWSTLADGSTQFTSAVDCEIKHTPVTGSETFSLLHRALYLQLKLDAGTANVQARVVSKHGGIA